MNRWLVVALMTTSVTLSCQSTESAPDSDGFSVQQHFIEPVEELLAHWDSVDSGELRFYAMSTLPPETLLVGGEINQGTGSICAVLLKSPDGGKSWTEVIRAHGGCAVYEIVTWSTTHAWALVCFNTEGTQSPQALYRTVDGGLTWERCPVNGEAWDIGIIGVGVELDFMTGMDGYAQLYSLTDSTRRLLLTHDGGRTWEVAMTDEATHARESGVGFPDGPISRRPGTVTWRDSEIDSVLRIVSSYEDGVINVEVMSFDEQGAWRPRFQFPRELDLKDLESILNVDSGVED